MLIDSHAHLDMKAFDEDRKDVLDRALAGGVGYIISIGIDTASSLRALELAKQYDFIYSSVGFHPHAAKDIEPEKLLELKELASEPKVVAWGEIGLDFYRDYAPHDKQIEGFIRQLEMAADVDLPVIIHNREADGKVLAILKKMKSGERKGVIHCFSGDYKLAMELIDMGYYISIPGTVTYKNALRVQDVAARIPLDRMLLETDAPFLAPVPKRGKRNEPLFVTHTAKKIAALRNVEFEDIALKTTENVKRLFGLST